MERKTGHPVSSKKGPEWAFFRDENGHIGYNKICQMCSRECKQSFRVDVILWSNYEHRR